MYLTGNFAIWQLSIALRFLVQPPLALGAFLSFTEYSELCCYCNLLFYICCPTSSTPRSCFYSTPTIHTISYTSADLSHASTNLLQEAMTADVARHCAFVLIQMQQVPVN
jgi:hypothetical protein